MDGVDGEEDEEEEETEFEEIEEHLKISSTTVDSTISLRQKSGLLNRSHALDSIRFSMYNIQSK